MTEPAGLGKRVGALCLYVALIGASVTLFQFICQRGSVLYPSTSAVELLAASAPPDRLNSLFHVLLALATVIIVARALGALFRRAGQPSVLGEIVAGILLGPSYLGAVAPAFAARLLPRDVSPLLAVVSQLGVILYMFMVGLDLDLKSLKKSGHVTIAISHASIVLPFLLGSLLALLLYPTMSNAGVPFRSFALFMGVSMSVTAFPVLARILTDQNIQRTPLGRLALACAAIDDVTAWCLLALVISLVQADPSGALRTCALTVAYVTLMFAIGRPAMKRYFPFLRAREGMGESGMTILFISLLLSSLVSELIGIHAIFGAFLLGAVTPYKSRVSKQLTHQMESLVRVLLLPAFFAVTGLRTQIGLIHSAADWLLLGLIVLVATTGKLGGTLLSARFLGLGWREAASLGALMNTRGLVELIVLNIGLDLGVLSPRLFTMLVLMALSTTFATTPLLQLFNARPSAGNPGKSDH